MICKYAKLSNETNSQITSNNNKNNPPGEYEYA